MHCSTKQMCARCELIGFDFKCYGSHRYYFGPEHDDHPHLCKNCRSSWLQYYKTISLPARLHWQKCFEKWLGRKWKPIQSKQPKEKIIFN